MVNPFADDWNAPDDAPVNWPASSDAISSFCRNLYQSSNNLIIIHLYIYKMPFRLDGNGDSSDGRLWCLLYCCLYVLGNRPSLQSTIDLTLKCSVLSQLWKCRGRCNCSGRSPCIRRPVSSTRDWSWPISRRKSSSSNSNCKPTVWCWTTTTTYHWPTDWVWNVPKSINCSSIYY